MGIKQADGWYGAGIRNCKHQVMFWQNLQNLLDFSMNGNGFTAGVVFVFHDTTKAGRSFDALNQAASLYP